METRRGLAVGVVITLLVLVVVLLGFLVVREFRGPATVKLETPYQAILLANGQAYFGKIESLASRFPVMTDVHYVQTQVNQETKQTTNVLVRRGKEWHAPDRMILNASQIVLIEPVTEFGKCVAKAGLEVLFGLFFVAVEAFRRRGEFACLGYDYRAEKVGIEITD